MVSVAVAESDWESLAVAVVVRGVLVTDRLDVRVNVLLSVRLLVLEGNPSTLGKFFVASTSVAKSNEANTTRTIGTARLHRLPA
jgi:hypothetical protein